MRSGQKNPIRLLFLINSLRVSGTEVLMFSLAQELTRKGCEVYLFPLITPFDQGFKEYLKSKGSFNVVFPPVVERFDAFFWRINGLTQRIFGWSFRSYFLRRYLSSQWKKHRFDVVVSNTYPADILAVEWMKEIKSRLVVVDHGAYCNFLATDQPFDPVALQAANVVVAVSQWAKAIISRRFPDLDIKVIYNGHSGLTTTGQSHWFTSRLRESSHLTFCIHGRSSPQKGFDIAVEAYQQVKAQGYKIRLLILSEGELIDQLKLQHQQDPDIIFGGFIYNLGDVLPDVYAGLVLSKKSESFGLSVLDYFSAGRPVVASGVGGIPEVIRKDAIIGGILIDATPDGVAPVDEVAKAMIRLIDDAEFYQTCRNAAARILQEYSMKNCSEKYFDLFQDLVRRTIN